VLSYITAPHESVSKDKVGRNVENFLLSMSVMVIQFSQETEVISGCRR